VKRIGLLGGMSWQSSSEYYRLINEATAERLGGMHSADCVMRSIDFAEIEELQRGGAWRQAGHLLAGEARLLEAAGSELLVLCTNTMHNVADVIEAAIAIPLVHIADATAEAVRAAGLKSVGLIATAYTMEQEFYVGRLRELHGLEVIVPDHEDRQLVHEVIFNELCLGVIKPRSRQAYRAVIDRLVKRGAAAIILGCTEIGLLISADDVDVPVFDTAAIHAQRAVELALARPG